MLVAFLLGAGTYLVYYWFKRRFASKKYDKYKAPEEFMKNCKIPGPGWDDPVRKKEETGKQGEKPKHNMNLAEEVLLRKELEEELGLPLLPMDESFGSIALAERARQEDELQRKLEAKFQIKLQQYREKAEKENWPTECEYDDYTE